MARNDENLEVAASRLMEDGCLDYSNDHHDRHVRANQLLRDCPELTSVSIWSAATTGDQDAVRRFLEDDPDLLEAKGGPRNWEPLLYACYSRVESNNPQSSTLEVGRILLSRGANPNAVYWWDGKYPFTALTGVCGEGERGPVNQPRHPHWREFADLLLERGARPDDNQALYNRMFGDDNELLELLLAHGLNNSHYPADECTGGRPAPSILGYQLSMAASRGREVRVRLLLEHKPRMDEPAYGKLPWEHAVFHGHLAIARLLEEHGAPVSELPDTARFSAACLDVDRETASELLTDNPDLMEMVPRDLLERAAVSNRIEAARLILELGFDVNTMEQTTALHQAAWHGLREMAEFLVAAGADPSKRDREHYATPGDWAHYAGQTELAAYLNHVRLDMFEAIGNNLIHRLEEIVRSDPDSLRRPFREYHTNPPRANDSLSPLEFARQTEQHEIAQELERLISAEDSHSD